MSQREQTFKVSVTENPDTPFSRERTLFITRKDADSARQRAKKFGKVNSCIKFVTDRYYKKIEFMDKPKGAKVVDDSFTLKEAIEFNNRIVIEDGFTLNKSMRLVRLERNLKDKSRTLDEILGDDD